MKPLIIQTIRNKMIPDIEQLLGKIHNHESKSFMQTLPDNCIDLTVTSPPYDNLRTYNQFDFDFQGMAKELFRITTGGGILVWIVGDACIDGSETGTSFKQALFFKDCGFRLHDTMIYEKKGCPFPESNRYNQKFEYMFVLSKGSPKTTNILKQRTLYSESQIGNSRSSTTRNKDGTMEKMKYETNKEYTNRFNIWIYGVGYMKSTKDTEAFEHPAIFPEMLAHDHILSWSNPGDVVYDCFAGSGTVAKMAERNNRKWLGSEISAEYCEIANRRIEAERSQLKLF